MHAKLVQTQTHKGLSVLSVTAIIRKVYKINCCTKQHRIKDKTVLQSYLKSSLRSCIRCEFKLNAAICESFSTELELNCWNWNKFYCVFILKASNMFGTWCFIPTSFNCCSSPNKTTFRALCHVLLHNIWKRFQRATGVNYRQAGYYGAVLR